METRRSSSESVAVGLMTNQDSTKGGGDGLTHHEKLDVFGSSSDSKNQEDGQATSGSNGDEEQLDKEPPSRSRSNALDVNTLSPRRRKRILANREAAHRSRMRKLKHIAELEAAAGRLERENEGLKQRLMFARQGHQELQNERSNLIMHVEYLRDEERRLRGLNDMMVQEMNMAVSLQHGPSQ